MPRRRRIPARLRREVAARARERCEYCLSPEVFSIDSFEIDHIDPAGSNDSDNLAFCCHNCNNHKQDATSAIDPETGIPALLYNPRLDAWTKHFQWSEDSLTILALTPTGRATITRLHLNRVGVVNVRRVLFAVDVLG